MQKEEYMNFRYLIAVLLAFLVVSCSTKKIDKLGFSLKNNIIYRNDSPNPYTGIIKSKTEGKYFEYTIRDGLKYGLFKVSYINGNLIMKGNIFNDKNEGTWLYYYPSGQLESQGNFKYNLADSIWTWYFPNGHIKERGLFVSGLREGNWKMYDTLGNISMESEFKNGISPN
jgi:antitoxin component YwqK of YwqJK toxin-antitoxin module